jgi:hypothetical protein
VHARPVLRVDSGVGVRGGDEGIRADTRGALTTAPAPIVMVNGAPQPQPTYQQQQQYAPQYRAAGRAACLQSERAVRAADATKDGVLRGSVRRQRPRNKKKKKKKKKILSFSQISARELRVCRFELFYFCDYKS